MATIVEISSVFFAFQNAMFEEAEPEFTTVAFFRTRIGLRNALQDEMIPGSTSDQEVLLITLTRPIIFLQPHAFDKGEDGLGRTWERVKKCKKSEHFKDIRTAFSKKKIE